MTRWNMGKPKYHAICGAYIAERQIIPTFIYRTCNIYFSKKVKEKFDPIRIYN